MTEARIPDFHTPRQLAELTRTDLRLITWLAWGLRGEEKYKGFEIARRNGSTRQIHAPVKPLKDLQRILATLLLDAYRRPAHVHGFARQTSPKTNASVHVKKFHVLRVDLRDFFPSITQKRVKGLFRAWPFEYPDEVALLLARVCCHNDALPQGAPTSPIVSNLICRRMDRQLAQLAALERCHFSRYADDLSFSTSKHVFPSLIASVEAGVPIPGAGLHGIVKNNGFTINSLKTTLTSPTQRQRVTGLVVNEKVNIPREYVRSLRALLYIWGKYGKAAAETSMAKHHPRTPNRPDAKPTASFEHVVRGRVQHIGYVKGPRNPTYVKLAKRLSEIDAGFSPPPRPIIEAALYTEGPSDWRHVLAAQRYFHEHGEFEDFILTPGKEPSKEGHPGLRKFAEKLGQEEQSGFSVCLFDNDVKEARDAVGEDGWKRYGPRVVAVGLDAPEHREPRAPIFIESLYEDSVLKTPLPSGRRLFLYSEFDHRIGHHLTEPCSIPGAGSKAFIQQKVHEFKTKKPLGASKVEFSETVLDSPEAFGAEIFAGFRPTFARIEAALRDSWDQLE